MRTGELHPLTQPCGEQSLALARVDHADAGDGTARLGQRVAQEGDEVPHQPADRRRLEQIRLVVGDP